MNASCCKCCPCTCNNKENKGGKQKPPMVENNHVIDVEQNLPMDENTNLVSTDNNATRKYRCSCKTIMNILICCFWSVPLTAVFVYTVVIIVSYTAYIIVYVFYFMWWALVTSPTETAGVLIFVSGGIVFVCKIVNDGISFYKELFNLTIDVCQQNDDCTKNKYIKLQNGIIYIKKDIVRTVQQAIYPFYISIGYTIMKLIAVILLYISYFLVNRICSLHTSTPDNFKNVTLVFSSALPTLLASQFKHKLPNKNTVKHIVHCYVEKAGSSNVNLQNGQVLQSPPTPDHMSKEEEEETSLKTLTL